MVDSPMNWSMPNAPSIGTASASSFAISSGSHADSGYHSWKPTATPSSSTIAWSVSGSA
jgi:hypothetical protein